PGKRMNGSQKPHARGFCHASFASVSKVALRDLDTADFTARKGPGLVVGDGLLDLLAAIHHERTVLHYRLAQRLAGEEQYMRAVRIRFDSYLISVGKQSCRAMRERLSLLAQPPLAPAE